MPKQEKGICVCNRSAKPATSVHVSGERRSFVKDVLKDHKEVPTPHQAFESHQVIKGSRMEASGQQE